jgi:haloalkane dehalogenase
MDRREFLAAAGAVVAASTLTNRTLGAINSMSLMGSAGPIDAAAFHAMRKFVKTPFGRIACVERGAGPVALFAHGDPLNGFQWRGALERLSPIRRCIAPDFMGLGYGEIPEGQDLGPEAQAEMYAALLDALHINSVDLVGSDSGGAVAQIFLARYPKRVRTLLLTNCDVYDDSPPAALASVIEGSRKGTFVDDAFVPSLADKEKARATLGTAYTNPAHLTDEAVEVYMRPATTSPLRKAQFHAYQIALERNPLLSIVPQLKRSKVPVRVVWGTGDTIFKPSGPDSLAQLFPRFRGTRKVDGAKLFWPEEMPDIIAEEARKLWMT